MDFNYKNSLRQAIINFFHKNKNADSPFLIHDLVNVDAFLIFNLFFIGPSTLDTTPPSSQCEHRQFDMLFKESGITSTDQKVLDPILLSS